MTLLALVPICALATTLTPLGLGLAAAIRSSIAVSRVTGLVEWQPSSPDTPFGIMFLVLGGAFLFLLFKRRGEIARAPWHTTVLVAAALALLPLGFYAVRNAPMFLLVAMPAVTRVLGCDFRVRGMRWAEGASPTRSNAVVLVTIVITQAAIVTVLWRARFNRMGWDPINPGALAAIQTCPGQMYNHYNDGGFLIWFAKQRPVFIDGRQDPYPWELILDHLSVEGGAPYQPMFERYGIECAILRAGSPMLHRLEIDGWRPRFRDPEWAVLVAPAHRRR